MNYYNIGETSGPRRTAMIWRGGTARADQLAALATAAGCVIVANEAASEIDFLLIDLCSETDRPADSLSEIVGYLQNHCSTALVWTDMEGLDAAYVALPQPQCHFLVNADDVEAVPILAGALDGILWSGCTTEIARWNSDRFTG